MAIGDSARRERETPVLMHRRCGLTSSAAVRIAAGIGVFLVTATRARRPTVAMSEVRAFRACNRVSGSIYRPVWPVMQLGSLGGVFAVALVLGIGRRRRSAAGILGGGIGIWFFAKMVKRLIGRGRPESHLDAVTVHGPRQSGLGFPSGHAAVAVALAAVASRQVRPPAAAAMWTAAGLVGWSRLYVGAHLPLDVIGGIGLGVATGAATNLALEWFE